MHQSRAWPKSEGQKCEEACEHWTILRSIGAVAAALKICQATKNL